MNTRCLSLMVITLVTLSITTSVFGGKGKEILINVDEYITCIPLLFRPPYPVNVPSRRIQMFGETLQATRHHIIPFNVLRTFMNLILTTDPFTSGLGSFLALSVQEIYRYFEENAEAGAFPPLTEPQRPNPNVLILRGDMSGRDPSFDVDHRMLAAFTWLPGNLFYGPPPNRRSYDPGDRFEVNAATIVGDVEYRILHRLYNYMQFYINYPDQRTATMYDRIMADLTRVSRARSRPYEFYQDHWVVTGVKDGKKLFDIKKPDLVLEEITTTTTPTPPTTGPPTTTPRDELKRDVDEFGDSAYLEAAEIVCNEYLNHMEPKLHIQSVEMPLDEDIAPLSVYSTRNGKYMYGQGVKTRNWVITTIDEYGRAIRQRDAGSWDTRYQVSVPFEIEGRNYLFIHDSFGHNFFIRELTDDGKMGPETDRGFLDNQYQVMFYFEINGREHYLYGQTSSGKSWMLMRLNAGGTINRNIVAHGKWDFFFDMQFPFTIGDKQYIAGHDTKSRAHFIREIDENSLNTCGVSVYWNNLDRGYNILFPFSLAGKTYFFGYSSHDEYYFIRKVFGDVVEGNNHNFGMVEARPFDVEGCQYFYARIKDKPHWYQLHFDFKYVDV